MRTYISPICLALTFTLAACDNDNGSSSSASETNSSETSDETTGDETTGNETTGNETEGPTGNDTTEGTTSDETTSDATTTSESDSDTNNACDACDANASCENDACVCNDGYEGNGESCSDVDECAMGLDQCNANASCSNNDGGYDCTCNEGFEGNGMTCTGTAGYGEACEDAIVCESGLCIGPPYSHCSEYCNQQVANDCPNVGALGLCVPLDGDQFGCVGDLEFGLDGDDAILGAGDSLTRSLGNLTDADLFHMELLEGTYGILVEPQGGDDVQLEVYNAIGEPIGILNDNGPGVPESAQYTTGTGVSFAVVRNVGNTTGPYTFSIEAL